MRQHAEKIVCEALKKAVDSGELKLAAVPEALVERPRDPEHGDWATALALRLSKELRRAPREIAEVIAAHIQQDASIASVEVAGPGFINLRLSEQAHQQVIRDAREQKSAFGSCDLGLEAGVPKTINVEFISANPTGPMHVGHGRWAALGNALCNVLEHAGWQVTREFYVNDAGSQMDLFGESIVVRYLQLCGLAIKLADNHYAGAYIIDLAQAILDLDGQRWFFSTDKAAAEDEPVEPDTTAEPEKPTEQDMTAEPDVTAEPEKPTEPDVTAEKERLAYFREFGYTRMLEHMKAICAQLGVHFDIWYSERSLYQGAAEHETEEGGAQTASPLIQMLRMLDAGGYLYDMDGATWFKTTELGDDKDRVLVKADGKYTYFAPDIAYHNIKFDRGSEYLINIWGADHHGYIPRMKAACTALGHEGKLTVVLGQLVNLFRGGELVRMSKRTGELVTFEELVEEVGADATKYLMLARSSDQPIDFDIEVAKKQDSSNPVYYVQYAHARICSLLRKAAEQGVTSPSLDAADLTCLTHPAELGLARILAQLEEVVESSARDLAPFRLTHYAEELATVFHRFYTECQVISADEALTLARLYLADATRNVLAVTLGLLGVSAPERM